LFCGIPFPLQREKTFRRFWSRTLLEGPLGSGLEEKMGKEGVLLFTETKVKSRGGQGYPWKGIGIAQGLQFTGGGAFFDS